MWVAAERVYTDRLFKSYAILGDDVVITDSKVAEESRQILSDLESQISTSKSLISKSGAFDFAKRFFVEFGRVDLSPISMAALMMCRRTALGLYTIRNTFSITNGNALLGLGDAGYRVFG